MSFEDSGERWENEQKGYKKARKKFSKKKIINLITRIMIVIMSAMFSLILQLLIIILLIIWQWQELITKMFTCFNSYGGNNDEVKLRIEKF